VTARYRVEVHPSAVKTLRKMDPPTARRLYAAVHALADNPRPAAATALVGGDGQMRLRVGDYRVIYEIEDDRLLVASDRISIYDVIMPTAIPDKGKVLTQMSNFWFENTTDIVPNHFISNDVPEEVAGRAVRVRKLEMYPVECVVRGYLSGSGWKEYQESRSVCAAPFDGTQAT